MTDHETTTPGAQRTMPPPVPPPSKAPKGGGRATPIPLSKIDKDSNVRTDMDDGELKTLAATIDKHGLIQPIVIRQKGDRYGLLYGARRLAAHELLAKTNPKFEVIDAIIVHMDDELLATSLDVRQLIENVARENLSPLDTAAGIAKYVEGTDEVPVPEELRKERIEEIAAIFAWSTRTVKKHLAFFHAPAWFRDLGKQVRIPKRREGADGKPELDAKTGKPIVDILKRPPLTSSFLEKLLALLNEANDVDKKKAAEDGSVKPRARAIIERLAFACAEQEWSIQKLEREIAAAKAKLHGEVAAGDPAGGATTKSYTATESRLVLDLKHKDTISAQDRAIIAAQAHALLMALGFSEVVIRA